MTDFSEAAPSDRSGQGLADWVEAMMIVEGRMRISRTALRRRLRGAGAADLNVDVDLLLGEVERRRRIAPDAYPFERTDRGIARVDGVPPTLYAFLLWLSAPFAPVRRESRYRETDEWFDELVLNVLLAYLGPASQGVRFGWPASGDRPTSFPDAVKWLAGLLRLSEGVGEPSTDIKDGGVDVIAWKHFGDQRTGFLVALAQVTAEDNWRSKFGDVLLKKWHGWIDFGADPVTALAVPFAISTEWQRWDELRRATTLLLDRFRLCEFLSVADYAHAAAVEAWVESERQKMELGYQPAA